MTKISSLAKRHTSTHKNPFREVIRGWQPLPLPKHHVPPLNFPGFFMGPTSAFSIQNNMQSLSQALTSCPLSALNILLEANKGHNFPTITVMHR